MTVWSPESKPLWKADWCSSNFVQLFISYIISWEVWFLFYAYHVWDMLESCNSCVLNRIHTGPFLPHFFCCFLPLFSCLGPQGYMSSAPIIWYVPLGILSCSFVQRELQLLEETVSEACKDSPSTSTPISTAHLHTHTKGLNAVSGWQPFETPKCLETSLLVPPIRWLLWLYWHCT